MEPLKTFKAGRWWIFLLLVFLLVLFSFIISIQVRISPILKMIIIIPVDIASIGTIFLYLARYEIYKDHLDVSYFKIYPKFILAHKGKHTLRGRLFPFTITQSRISFQDMRSITMTPFRFFITFDPKQGKDFSLKFANFEDTEACFDLINMETDFSSIVAGRPKRYHLQPP